MPNQTTTSSPRSLENPTNSPHTNAVGAGRPGFGIGSLVVATTGGNDFDISRTKNLHAYWDDSTVIGAMRLKNVTTKSPQDFAQAVVNAPPPAWRTAGAVDTWPTTMGDGSAADCEASHC
jgi:hypothetical protein